MSTQPGWGIIGTGGIAALQVQDLLTAGMRVAAVGSRKKKTANAFADRFGIANRHGSYEELAADPDVDIVYVATPHPFHVSNTLTAIKAGKHVLVEKPFTINSAEARSITEAANEKGVFVMEAMWTRFLPTMTAVMERIRAGEIGTPRVLLADHNQYLPRTKAVRLHEPELGGGALLDLGIYPLSFASALFGLPNTVTARGTLTDLGVDELTAMILEYESGAQASLHTGFLTPGPNVASVIGTKGRIDLDAVWYNQTSFSRYDRDGMIVERYTDRIAGRGMQYQALEVERCIAAGLTESPVMPLSESVAIMETMDTVRKQIGVTYPSEKK
jgi:predicted dehydrogenase